MKVWILVFTNIRVDKDVFDSFVEVYDTKEKAQSKLVECTKEYENEKLFNTFAINDDKITAMRWYNEVWLKWSEIRMEEREVK